MLGVIWRENPCRWLKPDESPVLMATLMECDENNQPLAGAYIDRSGLDAEHGLRNCSGWLWFRCITCFAATVSRLLHTDKI